MIHLRGGLTRGLALAVTMATALACAAMPVRAERLIHTDPSRLAADLEAARAGDRLLLAPGDYAAATVTGLEGRADAPITLQAADPTTRPRLERLTLRDARGVTLRSLDILPGPLGLRDAALTLRGTDAIVVEDVEITGQDPLKGFGLLITESRGILLDRLRIAAFHGGLHADHTDRLEIRASFLHQLGSDGMTFAAVQDVTIEDNTIRDFSFRRPEGAHPDMIQFWTRGTDRPSARVTIRGNRLVAGSGPWTQSIFMRNEIVDMNQAGPAMFYRDITIEENVIVNAHLHGITVGEAEGLTIRHNTVVRDAATPGRSDDPNLSTPRIRVADGARDVLILSNVAPAVPRSEGRPDWLVAGNMLVQDRQPFSPGYYGTVFRGIDRTRPARVADFVADPSGPLAGARIGAPMLRSAAPAPQVEADPVLVEGAIRLLPDGSAFEISAGDEGIRRVSLPLKEVRIGDVHPAVRFTREDSAALFGAEAFRMKLRVVPRGRAPGGEVLRLHQTMVLTVTDRGRVKFELHLDDGSIARLTGRARGRLPPEGMEIEIGFDDAEARLWTKIDGQPAGEVYAAGRLPPARHWGLVFGNPFGTQNTFEGRVDAFTLDVRHPESREARIR